MTNFQIRSKSISQARALFEVLGNRAWHIRTRTNRISPHITITFSSNLSLSDLRKLIADTFEDHLIKSSLRMDSREVLLV